MVGNGEQCYAKVYMKHELFAFMRFGGSKVYALMQYHYIIARRDNRHDHRHHHL
jgi:hypothetical protein